MNACIFLIPLLAAFGTTSATVAPAGQEQQDLLVTSNDGNTLPTVMNANLMVDDEMTVYADGREVGSNKAWNQAKRFQMPVTTEVVAIKAKNIGGPYGIRASFDGARLVTDTKRWRCSASRAPRWHKSTFDDSKWPLATEVTHGISNIINNQIVNANAKWIWTGSAEDEIVYCRAFMDVTGYVQVDDHMNLYADGKLIATNRLWSAVNSYNIPGATHVIAITGKNTGGPYGIRASFNGKKLVTSDQGRWRCSNSWAQDWEKPSFNDKGWPVARKKRHYTRKSSIDVTAKWIWGRLPTKTYCRSFLHMFATLVVDDKMVVYADGVFIGKAKRWNIGRRYRMPGGTRVVAIKATNFGGPCGIKGIFAAGRLVTDKTWKCSSTGVPNWHSPTFDDSSWPAAREMLNGFPKSTLRGYRVRGHGTKWIWSNFPAKTVYCRGYIRPVAALVTGVEDSHPAQASVNGNTAVATGNHVQGNQAQTTGNMAGFNMAAPQVHRVVRKKKPTPGRFHVAGANAGIEPKVQRVLKKNNQRVQSNLDLPNAESLSNVI